MDNQTLIIAALAKECCVLLKAQQPSNSTLPTTQQPEYLLWMSKQISNHADDWPLTKIDQDLIDHLDPENAFRLEIGRES